MYFYSTIDILTSNYENLTKKMMNLNIFKQDFKHFNHHFGNIFD